MMKYIIVSLGTGVLFALTDGLINANPLARRLYAVYKPIARESVNMIAGFAIDIAYGFAMAAIFLLLQGSLPGESAAVRGLAFGVLAWFFRVVMQVASQWMMFRIPVRALLYTLVCGLVEMLVLGFIFGTVLGSR